MNETIEIPANIPANEDTAQINIRLKAPLKKKLKAFCVEHNTTIHQLIIDFIERLV
jgi:hypothetical protein